MQPDHLLLLALILAFMNLHRLAGRFHGLAEATSLLQAVQPSRMTRRSQVHLLARAKAGGAHARSGTIRKLGPNKWQVRTEAPRGLDGKRRRKAKTIYGTQLEAEAALLELRREMGSLARTNGADRPVTVGELLDRWLSKEVEPTVRRSTFLDYQRKADTYVRPYLEHIPLEELDLAMVEEFRNELLKRPRRVMSKKTARSPKGRLKKPKVTKKVSEATVKAGLKTLSMALNYAVRHGFIRVNEVSNLKRMNWKKKSKRKALTEEQLKAFLAAAQNDYWYPMLALLANTGMRPSEALGLEWSHIDWERNWISIEQKLTLHPDGTFEFDEPKTQNSERRVPLSPGLRRLLERHRRRQEVLRAYDPEFDLVFGNLDGFPADSRNILRNHVKPIAKRAGIPQNVTLYSLRYSFMTLSTGSTRAPKLTSRVLGHGTVSFSEDVYNDPDDEALRESTLTMDSFLPESEEDETEGGEEDE